MRSEASPILRVDDGRAAVGAGDARACGHVYSYALVCAKLASECFGANMFSGGVSMMILRMSLGFSSAATTQPCE